MRRVLFVCTGNIFRSLAAEYALRHVLGARSDIMVASAGTEDFPHVVSRNVRDYLLARGLNVSRHRRRTLTAQILHEPGPVIAMSTEHRSGLGRAFQSTGRSVIHRGMWYSRRTASRCGRSR